MRTAIPLQSNGGEFDEATGYKKDRRSLWSAYELRNFANGEYLRTLRLVSKLPELRVANANRYSVAEQRRRVR